MWLLMSVVVRIVVVDEIVTVVLTCRDNDEPFHTNHPCITV